MLGVGDRIPAAQVWIGAGADPVTLDSIADGAPYLVFFYLYDWSAT
jgi:hypothetical protein